MKQVIIEVPDNFTGTIENCILLEHGCGEFGRCEDGCPFTAAIPVQEIKSPERILWHKAAPGLRVFKTEEKV